jgi:hypothetical protein
VHVTRILFAVSAAALAATGLGYVVVPSAMLGIVGIAGDSTTEFLIRTEGVALLTLAAVILLLPIDAGWRSRGALFAVTGYLLVGSIVDLRAFADGIVGPASVPSAALRIGVGVVCVVVATRAVAT